MCPHLAVLMNRVVLSSSQFLHPSFSVIFIFLCSQLCLRSFLLPSVLSVCFHSSVMGLVAAPDYMFPVLRWQVVFKVGPI